MAEIVTTTYLEMSAPAEIKPRTSPDSRLVIRETVGRQWQLNRFLYTLVGEPWRWTDRLSWSAAQWQSYVHDDALRTFVACVEGSISGYYELHRDEARAVEIAYFGLAPDFIGRGLGGAFLTDALQRAWAWNARWVWVHTCTRDHPAALKNYEARGMTIYDRQSRAVA